MRQVFAISCLSAAGLGLVCKWAVPLVFGKQFGSSVAVIWWLLPGTVALAVAKVAASDLAGRAKTGYSSVFGLMAFAATVILDWELIPRMGIQGAALASSIAYSLNGLLLVMALKREIQVGWAELLVPRRAELRNYKKVWEAALMWQRVKRASAT
jgi:O-antigen/teichoic acid export membrane protein